MISIAAINVNKKGTSCVGAISELAEAQKVDVMALSEVDVLPSAGPGYIKQWSQLGWQVCLSEAEPRGSRVALVSSIPFRPVSLCKREGRTRCAAGLFDVQGPDGVHETILIVSTYCQSGDEVASSLQAEDILQSSFGTRLRYFALGDWNCEQTQNSIGQLIANGVVRAADDCADGCVLPCTGPGRKRRIDYGVCHWQLPATSVRHYSCHVSDHLAVQYQCDLQAPRCRTGPRRRPVGDVSADSLELYFATWNVQPFHTAMGMYDVDTAWTFLCNHAEDALCGTIDDHAVPRSGQWKPSTPKPPQRPGKGQVGSEVVGLLRTLLNKLQVLRHRPWDQPLSKRVLRSLPRLRALGADLPFINEGDELSLIASANSQLQHFERQEQQAIKEEWSRRLKTDEATLRSFIKNRAESQLEWDEAYPSADAVIGGLHPACAIAAESESWRAKWTNQKPDCSNALLASVLEHVPRPPPATCDFNIEVEELRAAMSSMKDRSGGPDDWKAHHLLSLPPSWWHLFTTLWNHCIEHGTLPKSWREAKVVLLFKKKGGTRPITLTQLVWRAGAKCLTKRLRSWCLTWMTPGDAGGLPGTSVEGALMQLSCALNDRVGVVVQQDIRGFFDAICVPDAIAILTHLRAPAPFIKLFGAFYKRCRRIFVLKGAHDESWFEPSRGIAQGCPFSPCIAAAITHVWGRFVLNQGVGGLGYMDDRTIWLPPSTPFDQLRLALDRSGQFDQALGFQVAIDKCRIVALHATPEVNRLAQTLGYTIATDFEFLGVRCTLNGAMYLLKFHVLRAAHRLRLLKWAAPSLATRRKMILSLVIPSFTWAAGWALPTGGEMTTLKHDILQAFTDFWGQQPATVLAFERIGWQCEPRFASDLALLRIAWRSHAKTPQWLELCPLSQAFPSACKTLPLLEPLLNKLGWSLSPDGATFMRHDDTGRLRSLCAGFEHFRHLSNWLLQHYRAEYVGKCGRVQKRFHREGQNLAQGLDLPPPIPVHRFVFKGHGQAFSESQGRPQQQAAVGTGASTWFLNAGGDFDPQHDRWRCICGKLRPSQAHLTWTCPATSDLRRNIRQPIDRAEERLLAIAVPEYPPATPGVAQEELVEEVAASLQRGFENHPSLLIATDGSSKDDIGGFGVVIHTPEHVHCSGDGSEDQDPFRQELLAIGLVFKALASLGLSQVRGSVCILSDCKAAMHSAFCGRSEALPRLAHSVWVDLCVARAHGFRVESLWVPAHGRHLRWKPPEGFDADHLRELNHHADLAAKAAMERRLRGSCRLAWHQQVTIAQTWEREAIRITGAASERLHNHLRTLGLRKGEPPLPGHAFSNSTS